MIGCRVSDQNTLVLIPSQLYCSGKLLLAQHHQAEDFKVTMSQRQPLAIVGYAYRAPDVGRKGLSEFLEQGKLAWSPVPSNRFNQCRGSNLPVLDKTPPAAIPNGTTNAV